MKVQQIVLWLSVLRAGLGSTLRKIFAPAIRQAKFEQRIEDDNTAFKINDSLHRKLIAMPLSDSFANGVATGLNGKFQFSDKCSFPLSLGKTIFEKPYEFPWIFEVKKIEERSLSGSGDDSNRQCFSEDSLDRHSPKVYASPLDFRAPENYVFLPNWIMNTLGVQSNDVVEVSFVRMKPATLIVLQPLSKSWNELLRRYPDTKSLLEHEINKYSSLTANTNIAIEVDGQEYPLFVQKTITEGGISANAVRIQDSDVKVDINRDIIDRVDE